jgi:hypothetical protein
MWTECVLEVARPKNPLIWWYRGGAKYQRLYVYLIIINIIIILMGLHAHDPEGRRIYCVLIMFLFPAWTMGGRSWAHIGHKLWWGAKLGPIWALALSCGPYGPLPRARCGPKLGPIWALSNKGSHVWRQQASGGTHMSPKLKSTQYFLGPIMGPLHGGPSLGPSWAHGEAQSRAQTGRIRGGKFGPTIELNMLTWAQYGPDMVRRGWTMSHPDPRNVNGVWESGLCCPHIPARCGNQAYVAPTPCLY